MPSLVIYDWSLYSTSLTQSDLETSTHGNDPSQTGANPYDPGSATWTGVDFTFNGGSGSVIDINDDDGEFQDGYVESGGAQTLSNPVTINGVTYPAGSVVENEFSLIDPGGNEVWVVRIDGVNVGFAYPEGNPPTAGDVFNANDTRDGDPGDSLDQTTPSSEAYGNMACFVSGTLISTDCGDRPVEALRPGDLVHTLDCGLQPVLWAGGRALTSAQLATAPHLRPVVIPKATLGNAQDLLVSQQHCLLLNVGESSVLVRAKHLAESPGPIRIAHGKRQVHYHHLFFERHQILWSNGALSESFFPGPQALKSLKPQDRARVLAHIGGVSGSSAEAVYGCRARPVLDRRDVLVHDLGFARRHACGLQTQRGGSQNRTHAEQRTLQECYAGGPIE